MDEFELGDGDLYFGDHELKELLEDESEWPDQMYSILDLQDHMDSILKDFFRGREEYKIFIDLFGQVNGLERYALLEAHGDTNGDWVYQDGGRKHAVQKWINSVDGKYSGLFICVCNPGTHTPKSKKSVLMIPDSNIDFTAGDGVITERNVCFDLYVPKIGLVDSYTVGYEIKKLEKRLQK